MRTSSPRRALLSPKKAGPTFPSPSTQLLASFPGVSPAEALSAPSSRPSLVSLGVSAPPASLGSPVAPGLSVAAAGIPPSDLRSPLARRLAFRCVGHEEAVFSALWVQVGGGVVAGWALPPPPPAFSDLLRVLTSGPSSPPFGLSFPLLLSSSFVWLVLVGYLFVPTLLPPHPTHPSFPFSPSPSLSLSLSRSLSLSPLLSPRVLFTYLLFGI